jgi:hypothetical protein
MFAVEVACGSRSVMFVLLPFHLVETHYPLPFLTLFQVTLSSAQDAATFAAGAQASQVLQMPSNAALREVSTRASGQLGLGRFLNFRCIMMLRKSGEL